MIQATVLTMLLLLTPQQTPMGTVRGIVTAGRDRRPIPGALVRATARGRVVHALTDERGSYFLPEVPAGHVRLFVQAIGYKPRYVGITIASADTFVVDIALEIQPVALRSIAIAVPAPDRLPDPPPSVALAELPPRTTGAVATLSPGLAGAGIAGRQTARKRNPSDPAEVLYMRGAAAQLDRILLDGAPVRTPFHMAGLIPLYAPGALGRATLYLGGAPARYGGGLSYILDLRTRPPARDAFHGAASLNSLGARASLEGPIGPVALRVGGRTIHPAGAGIWLESPFPYEYSDALARVDWYLPETGTLRATGFWNRESVRVGRLPGSGYIAWGNLAGSVRYSGRLAGTRVEVTAAVGEYRASVPETDIAEGSVVSRRLRLLADFSNRFGPVTLGYGIFHERWVARSTMGAPKDSVRFPTAAARRVEGASSGAYLFAKGNLGPALRVRGGVRARAPASGSEPHVSPRFAVTWAATRNATVTLASGRYHQLVRPDAWFIADSSDVRTRFRARSAAASHVLLRFEQELNSALSLGLEGYFKRFSGLPTARAPDRASGLNVWLDGTGKRFSGWLGYALHWAWTVPDPAGSSRFSGYQVLGTGFSGPLGAHGGFGISFAYGANLPYTPILSAASPRSGADAGAVMNWSGNALLSDARSGGFVMPLVAEPYLRFDIEVFRRWDVDWGGTAWRIVPFLRVLNALDQRAALFYVADRGRADPRPIAALPVLPVLGVRLRF